MKKLLLTLSTFLFMVSVSGAAVIISNTKPVNSKWQFVAVTLTADGDSCRDVLSTPVLTGETLQSYVDAHESDYILHVLKQMYPNAIYTITEGQTELEAFESWISSGHTNSAYCKPPATPYCTTEPVDAYCEGTEAVTEQECVGLEGTWHEAIPRQATEYLCLNTVTPAYCEGSEATTEETCETTWHSEVITSTDAEWITVFDTEAKCLLANAQWVPEEVIAKVPWVDSHEYTGTLRDRKLEELNADQTAYIAAHYDQGTQSAFTAMYVLPTTPQAVKDALLPVWTWIQGVTQYYYSKKIEIRDGENWNDVTWDFSQFDATDPHVSLEALMGG